MIIQTQLFEQAVNSKDIVYTPEHIAKGIIDYLQPNGVCLDPCKGGLFINSCLKMLIIAKSEKINAFLNTQKKVDWIIGNPPYSIFASETIIGMKTVNRIFNK